MKKKDLLSSAALVGILASGSALAHNHHKVKGGIHCEGIATKWVNDCGANGHDCAAQARTNFDRKEWLKMSPEDCKMVQKALRNKAVRDYVERIQKGTYVAAKRGKKL